MRGDETGWMASTVLSRVGAGGSSPVSGGGTPARVFAYSTAEGRTGRRVSGATVTGQGPFSQPGAAPEVKQHGVQVDEGVRVFSRHLERRLFRRRSPRSRREVRLRCSGIRECPSCHLPGVHQAVHHLRDRRLGDWARTGSTKDVHETDEPIPGRWYHAGVERTCELLRECGFRIVERDVGTCLRDPIIHFMRP